MRLQITPLKVSPVPMTGDTPQESGSVDHSPSVSRSDNAPPDEITDSAPASTRCSSHDIMETTQTQSEAEQHVIDDTVAVLRSRAAIATEFGHVSEGGVTKEQADRLLEGFETLLTMREERQRYKRARRECSRSMPRERPAPSRSEMPRRVPTQRCSLSAAELAERSARASTDAAAATEDSAAVVRLNESLDEHGQTVQETETF